LGIRGPKVGFKWPKVIPMAGLKHFSDRHIVKKKHALNKRLNTLLGKLKRDTQGHIGEGLVLHRCWLFLEVGVMLEGQVPMPYPFTGVQTLPAQASPVPYSGRAWGLPRASNQ
jgi:hypothetical protein